MTPLLIKVFGNSIAMTTAQAVIAALCWGSLALTVGFQVPAGWRRIVGAWSILAFATAFPITLWNRSVLSESISLSALALVFVTSIWTARSVTWPRVFAVVLVYLVFVGARDSNVATVAVLGVVIAVAALTRIRRNRGVALRLGSLACMLVALCGLASIGTISSHRTTRDVVDVFEVRIFPFPDRVAWFAARGMPERVQIDALARTSPAPPGQAKVVGLPVGPTFEPIRRWLSTDGGGAYLWWLVTHPGPVLTGPFQQPQQAFNYADGNLLFYASSVDPMPSPITMVVWPSALELGLLATAALYLAYRSDAWRLTTWRTVVVLTAIGLVAMLVAWNGDAQEVTRHTIEGFAQVHLGVWILVVLGLLTTPTSLRQGADRLSDHNERASSEAVGQTCDVELPRSSSGSA
ncbi:MAG: hypothetical protein ACYCYQ_06550 [Acidimicrobiales bacterium]